MDNWQLPQGFQMVYWPHAGRYAEGFDSDREYRFIRYGENSADAHTFRLRDQGPLFNIAGLYFATTGATNER